MATRNPALRCLHHWPTRILCLSLLLLQAASLNWYLMDNLSYTWAGIYGADAVVFVLFLCAMIMSRTSIQDQKHRSNITESDVEHMAMSYIAWFIYSILMSVKISVIFTKFATDLDEDEFFGPNTMKTTLALSGIIFLAYLATLHDLRHGHRKEIVASLTATVIFDILDGVDNLENLFDKEIRDTYPPGLDDTVIAICCINYVLPTVPLFTLAYIKYGLRRLPKRFELFHKLAIAYLVNLPMFITRMITWHGLSQGISIFALKNLIAMGVTAFDVLEHRFTQDSEEDEEEEEEYRNTNGQLEKFGHGLQNNTYEYESRRRPISDTTI